MIFWSLCSIRSASDCFKQILLYIFTVIFHPTGIFSVFVGIYLCIQKDVDKKNPNFEDKKFLERLKTIDYISKIGEVIECILESIPQIAIQGFNNYLNESWTDITYASMVFSILSTIYVIGSVLCMIDN